MNSPMANSNFTIRQLFEMDACTNCRLCADVCPAACAAQSGELSAVSRLKGLKQNLKARAGRLQRLFGSKPMSAAELKLYLFYLHLGFFKNFCFLRGNSDILNPDC